jgi:hypothetical protein
MTRKITIFLLAAGAVAGFTLGFARLHHGHGGHGCGYGRGAWGPVGHGRAAFEDHVADVCTRSAERVLKGRSNAPAPAPAAP